MKKYLIFIMIILFAIELSAINYDNRQNTISNVEFFNSNYGIIGQNIQNSSGGVFWPRNSKNMYVFGGGIWFGAIKKNPNTGENHKYCFVTYEPNTARSFAIPGSIDEGDGLILETLNNHKLYISTEYNADGTEKNVGNGPTWPLWINNNTSQNQFGKYLHTYVADTLERNYTLYPDGPLFVSDEDFYSRFKDTYLDVYASKQKAAEAGYPLRIQFEQNIYTWSREDLKDVIVLSYTIENKSQDTLFNCWIAPLYDVDIIGNTSNYLYVQGKNDRSRFVSEMPELNLGIAWSNADHGDEGNGLGYLGLSFIETPAVDANGYLRTDKTIFMQSEQLGLKSFRNWNQEEDSREDSSNYNTISSNIKDGDLGSGDKRILISTGPFNLKPGETVRIAYCLSFAKPSMSEVADGSSFDSEGLFNKISYAGLEYYLRLVLSVDDEQFDNTEINELYPNPTENKFSLEYNLKNSGNVNIGLYNQFGEEIQTLFQGWQTSGKYSNQYQLNAVGLSSGIYFIRIENGYEVKSKAISIVK